MVKCLSLPSICLTMKLERLTCKQSGQMIHGSSWINLVHFAMSRGHVPCRMSLFPLGQEASVAVSCLSVCSHLIREERAHVGRKQPHEDSFLVAVIVAYLVSPTLGTNI